MQQQTWPHDLVRAIDARDAARFAQFIAPDGVFVFSNQPPVTGRAAIEQYVAGFFGALKGLNHSVDTVFRDGDTVGMTGTVTYTRLDGSTLAVPFCNVFRMKGELIARYQIFIDNSKLFQPGA
jgi:limonene-1,2-epoxide hydrolase